MVRGECAMRWWMIVVCVASACDQGGEPGGASDAASDAAFDAVSFDAQVRAPIILAAGERTAMRVVVDRDRRRIDLLRGDERLLRFGADGFRLGVVDAMVPRWNYDPYAMLAGGQFDVPTPTLRWLEPETLEMGESGEGEGGERTGLVIELGYPEGATATLTFDARDDGRVEASWRARHDDADVVYYAMRAIVDREEAFYGLGETFDDVNHRGHVRGMQIEPVLEFESANNEANVPVPFLIGTRGWGWFIQDLHPSAFGVAHERDDRVDAIVGTGEHSPEGLRFHLFAEPHPLDLTRHYYEVTGYPKLPADWALGPVIWRDENDDQAQVEWDLAQMRELDLAANAYWIDRPYATGVNAFDWDPAKFDDAQAMIDVAHALGFRFGLWHTPYVDEEDPDTAELFAVAEHSGYFPPQVGVIANNWGRPLDFTNADAYAWWQGLLRGYTDMGVEGFKLDYAQDVVAGLASVRNVWEFADGTDDRTQHKQYQWWYHKVYAELLPETGYFLLCRAATFGGQTNGIIIWPGDLDANFARRGDEIEEDGECWTSVGGLPASMIAGLGLGPSGYPFYGADTGGYRHAPTDKELFTRWFEQTALSSVMQIGTNANDVAWEFRPENGFDEEMLDWYRIYVRLHLRLFPYEWTYAQRISDDGRPIQRPYGLQRPDLNVHPWDTYFFGDDLLVAPVMTRGARERDVAFPPGRWLDWWSGEVIDGGQTRTVDAPLDTLPLYLRQGGIVPLLRPTIDTMAPVDDPDAIDSFATTPGLLYPRVFPGEASAFVLYDGSAIEQSRDAATGDIAVTWREGEVYTHGAVIELLDVREPPASVRDESARFDPVGDPAQLDGVAAGWYHDAESGALFIRVTGREKAVAVSL